MNKTKKLFEKVYNQYVDKIYRFIFFKVDSPETAEDLTAQVFTKFWIKLREFNRSKNIELKNPGSYLYQIAKNEVIDHYRKKDQFQIVSTETIQIVDPSPSLEQKTQTQSDFLKIKKCLQQLKEDYQNVIILRHIENLSIKEIAGILDKSEASTRVLLHRALKQLKEKIERC